MIKLIACDMDGTFLNDRGTYDRERFEAILEALEARGIRFVVASGNNMDRLRLIFSGLEDRLSYVAENGGYILEHSQPLIRQYLNQSDVEAFLTYFEGHLEEYRVMVSHEDRSYTLSSRFTLEEFPMIDKEQMQLFLDRITILENFSDMPDKPILKLTMHLPVDQCDAIMADFNANFTGHLTAVTSGYGAVDVIQTGIHKAWGLEYLSDRWGISRDEIMAFGDGGNDIEMLSLAKYSYAMENAPDNVKNVAKYLAPHHAEEGVLTVLEAFLRGDLDD